MYTLTRKEWAHLAENRGSKTGKDAASKVDGECSRAAEVALRFFCHVAVRNLMAKLVDRELSNRVGNLPGKKQVMFVFR